jgi:chromosome partitioning protein
MQMKTVLVANSKGGVGKTTISTHLSAELARRGKKVLLVDAAPQGNAALLYGLKKKSDFYNWLVRSDEVTMDDVLTPVHQVAANAVVREGEAFKGELWMIRGNPETVGVPMHVGKEDMRLALEGMTEFLDYVIIDSDPSVSAMASMLYYAADEMLIPTKLNYLDIDAVRTTIESAPKQAGRKIPVMGIVPTFYVKNKVSDQNYAQLLKFGQTYGYPIFRPIRELAGFSEASNARRMVYTMDGETIDRAVSDILALVESFEKAMV